LNKAENSRVPFWDRLQCSCTLPFSSNGRARYHRNAVVQTLAEQLSLTLLSLPSSSPNLSLTKRLGKFLKRHALYGRYHPPFTAFQAAIHEVLASLPTTHAENLESLMTLNFQRFENVSLMAA
jgi:hypothetical protein